LLKRTIEELSELNSPTGSTSAFRYSRSSARSSTGLSWSATALVH